MDRHGNIAAYAGPKTPEWAGDRQGKTWSPQGNILVGPQVLEAMGRAFDSASGELAEKLFAALKAGDEAGGDRRGKQSAVSFRPAHSSKSARAAASRPWRSW